MPHRVSLLIVVFLLVNTSGIGQNKKHKPKFTIGRDTTYVEGPLDKDGYIDFAAALNERAKKEVTPANNANVLLWKALGPRPGKDAVPVRFFEELGMEAPPENGAYFIDLLKFMREVQKQDLKGKIGHFLDRVDRAAERPWSAETFPELAAWLKANEKPLGLVVQASKCSQCYSPCIVGKLEDKPAPLFTELRPGLFEVHQFAQALAVRAMLHVGEGRSDDAWQDLRACDRLGRLLGKRATLLQAFVANAYGEIAMRGELALLASPKVDRRQLSAWLGELRKLPPTTPLADCIDFIERLYDLDMILQLDRNGVKTFDSADKANKLIGGDGVFGSNTADVLKSIGELLKAGVDWDPVLRDANGRSDRLTAAMREKDRVLRVKKLQAIDDDCKALKVKLLDSGDGPKLLGSPEKMDAGARGKLIYELILASSAMSLVKVRETEDRTTQLYDNLQVAFALAAYQRDEGRYPKSLDALAPKYLAKIPGDLFTGKALVYQPVENGYVLFSFGPNGKDDGGRGMDDDPPGDDLTIRMPFPEFKRKYERDVP